MFLYFLNENILWKYEEETRTKVLQIPKYIQLFQDVSNSKPFGCAIIKETSTYLVFNIRDSNVLVCDLTRNTFVIVSGTNNIPDRWYEEVVATVVEDSNKIIVFITDIYVDRTSVWKFIYRNGVWLWKKWPDPFIALSSRLHSSYDVKDSYLTVVGGFSDKTFSMDIRSEPFSNGLI